MAPIEARPRGGGEHEIRGLCAKVNVTMAGRDGARGLQSAQVVVRTVSTLVLSRSEMTTQ